MSDDEYRKFVQSVIDNVKKNGFPDKKVSFPLEQMYEAAENKGVNFNKVLQTLDEIQIAHEKTPEKIIFYPKDRMPPPQTEANPAQAFANIDLGELKNMNMSDMMAAAAKMMQNMSPEQLTEATLTHQTDMFSLGVVIYQLLTGHLPFKGSTGFGMVNQILNVDADPPSTHRPQIPANVDEIVLKAMCKEPGERYATWDQFAHDLAKVFGKLDYADDTVPDAEKFSILRRLEFCGRVMLGILLPRLLDDVLRRFQFEPGRFGTGRQGQANEGYEDPA